MTSFEWRRWTGEKLKGEPAVLVTDGISVRCGWYDHLRMCWLTQEAHQPKDVSDRVESDDFETWTPTHYATLEVGDDGRLILP